MKKKPKLFRLTGLTKGYFPPHIAIKKKITCTALRGGGVRDEFGRRAPPRRGPPTRLHRQSPSPPRQSPRWSAACGGSRWAGLRRPAPLCTSLHKQKTPEGRGTRSQKGPGEALFSHTEIREQTDGGYFPVESYQTLKFSCLKAKRTTSPS